MLVYFYKLNIFLFNYSLFYLFTKFIKDNNQLINGRYFYQLFFDFHPITKKYQICSFIKIKINIVTITSILNSISVKIKEFKKKFIIFQFYKINNKL